MEKDHTTQSKSNHDQKISITVKDPLTDTSETRAFVTYLVTGKDQNGYFSIRRRYSDFYALR